MASSGPIFGPAAGPVATDCQANLSVDWVRLRLPHRYTDEGRDTPLGIEGRGDRTGGGSGQTGTAARTPFRASSVVTPRPGP